MSQKGQSDCAYRLDNLSENLKARGFDVRVDGRDFKDGRRHRWPKPCVRTRRPETFETADCQQKAAQIQCAAFHQWHQSFKALFQIQSVFTVLTPISSIS